MSEKKTSSKNSLTVPLILSLCMNLVLIVAVVIMAITMSKGAGSAAPVETTAPAVETEAPSETDSGDAEEQVYSFENADGETVEIVSYPNVYVQGQGYICAGDQSVWDFSYDEENDLSAVAITIDEETTNYDLTYFHTNEDESSARIVVQFSNEDGTVNSLWYLQTLVDDTQTDADGNPTVLGVVLESATDSTQNLLLCTPDYWEIYSAENSDNASDEAAAETEAPAEE